MIGSSAPRRVLIIGAGGFGRETAALLKTLQTRGEFEPAGFADDSTELHNRTVVGIPVLGAADIARDLSELSVVVTVGNPRKYDTRRLLIERLNLDPQRYATLVHPTASIGSEVTIGEGTVVLAGCVATQGVTIGRHVAMMPHVTLTHDDRVQDFATLGAGVMLGGGVEVGQGAYVGSGVSVREGTVIGARAMVGMGAVVVDDVPPGETWAGVPARPLSRSKQ
jgi:sugar O-acyltransferase (sialic acid O-acetyltransferase NeuD family)